VRSSTGVTALPEIKSVLERFGTGRDPYVKLVATEEEIRKGYVVLSEIASANEALRIFLVDRFKLEDVL
jgi:hypothetical protein